MLPRPLLDHWTTCRRRWGRQGFVRGGEPLPCSGTSRRWAAREWCRRCATRSVMQAPRMFSAQPCVHLLLLKPRWKQYRALRSQQGRCPGHRERSWGAVLLWVQDQWIPPCCHTSTRTRPEVAHLMSGSGSATNLLPNRTLRTRPHSRLIGVVHQRLLRQPPQQDDTTIHACHVRTCPRPGPALAGDGPDDRSRSPTSLL
mmetsp:Transcript_11881/g.31930  ORF Transcript_11881/g.31930 Transcript_11881/m.31930 type:complete len:200 (+) Transcript_11881:109-708(+)